jgi:hypothetical protein
MTLLVWFVAMSLSWQVSSHALYLLSAARRQLDTHFFFNQPQMAFLDVADRITGAVLDAGCGTRQGCKVSPASTSSINRSTRRGGKQPSEAWRRRSW